MGGQPLRRNKLIKAFLEVDDGYDYEAEEDEE
jgi:hypothetical protein